MANRNDKDKPSYMDENLTEEEKHGQTRVPSPEQEGSGKGKEHERPMSPQRDEGIGDGDRRS